MRYAAHVLVAILLLLPTAPVGAQDETIYTPGKDGVSHPVVVTKVNPHYPEAMLKEGRSAVVRVDAVVTREGLPKDVQVREPADPTFDEEAVKAVSQWRFKPGTRNGRPVAVRINVELTFTAKK